MNFQDDAQLEYIKVVNELAAAEAPAVSDVESGTAKKYNQLLVTNEDRIFKIVLNRPKKKNAIKLEVSNCILVHLWKSVLLYKKKIEL